MANKFDPQKVLRLHYTPSSSLRIDISTEFAVQDAEVEPKKVFE